MVIILFFERNEDYFGGENVAEYLGC